MNEWYTDLEWPWMTVLFLGGGGGGCRYSNTFEFIVWHLVFVLTWFLWQPYEIHSLHSAGLERSVTFRLCYYSPLPLSLELTDFMLCVGCRGSRKETWAWEPTAYTDQSCPYARHTFSLQWGSLVDSSWREGRILFNYVKFVLFQQLKCVRF